MDEVPLGDSLKFRNTLGLFKVKFLPSDKPNSMCSLPTECVYTILLLLYLKQYTYYYTYVIKRKG